MTSKSYHQIFMTSSEDSVNKLCFQDLIFLAGDVNHILPSLKCSIIHFEALGLYSNEYDMEYCEIFPLSKILWCVNAKTGECVDWSGDDVCSPKTLRHCTSYQSGLCNQNSVRRMHTSRSANWDHRRKEIPARATASNYLEVIEWKAIQEAEVLSKLPRYIDSAIHHLNNCNEPRVITERKVFDEGDEHHVISHVNEAWEELCGHRSEEAVGKSLSIMQGPDTDPDVKRALEDAVTEALDASVLIKNYKKSGEPFMNRARLVPMIDRGYKIAPHEKPSGFLAALSAPSPIPAESLGKDRIGDKVGDKRLFFEGSETPDSLEF